MKRKQQSQRPSLNHLTLGRTNPNFTSRSEAGCIHLGLITLCPETSHPQHLPGTYHPLSRGLITLCPKPPTPCSTANASQLKITQNVPPDKLFPDRFHKPPFKYEASLIALALSLVVRLPAAPPCRNSHLPLLKSSLLFSLGPNYTLQTEQRT